MHLTKYVDIFIDGYKGYFNYLISEITQPSFHNYFYLLIGISLLVWSLEMAFPWRKKQGLLRKDFFLDAFYMFFNFFLFSLIIYNSLSMVAVEAFSDFLALFGIKNLVAINVAHLPFWVKIALMFVVSDFLQWNIHRLLHRFDCLWRFHKLHHSVKEMGFAAHLRFHPFETIFYKTLQYIPLSFFGFGLTDFFYMHLFTILIGHLNHANLPFDYGPLKYILNNPKMHIWHHAKHLPYERRFGVNFALSLSVWDYLFKTNYIPSDGRDIELGFEHDESYPKKFVNQLIS